MLAACSSTDPTPPLPDAEPAGWIYFGAMPEPGYYLQRVSVTTGAIEAVEWSPAFPVGQTFMALPGMVSPLDGRISAQGYLGGSWPQTFIYQPADGSVDSPTTTNVVRDYGHVWSPDGESVAFVSHSVTGGDGRDRVLRLDRRSLALDTLFGTGMQESIGRMVWLGNDTLILDYFAIPGGSRYTALDVRSLDTDRFAEVPHEGLGGVLAFSASGRWQTLWSLAGGQGFDSLALTIADRTGIVGPRRMRALDFASTEPIAIVFDPTESFLADCPTRIQLRIIRLSDLTEVKRMPVPVCSSLSWSWGAGGPPKP